MNRVPSLDELIGAEATPGERERLRQVHELLLQAGPPPELPPELAAGPTLAMTLGRKRRAAKPQALMLLAATIAVAIVFLAGYVVANNGGGSATGNHPRAVQELALKGTSAAPNAEASLKVWQPKDGNLPMTLTVEGLPKLLGRWRNNYDVYLVRGGRVRGSCGTFRVTGAPGAVTVTLNAPYSLRRGDTWIVTRAEPNGAEPGKTVLEPVTE